MSGDLRTVALVPALPRCDFCWLADNIERPARFDFRTTLGPWAYGCERHYELHRRHPELGLGRGQYLLTRPEFEHEVLGE